MKKDRTAICNIISKMLDNADEYGIYPTTKAYDKLEEYVEQERAQAIGWTLAHCCNILDNNYDPRTMNALSILAQGLKYLERSRSEE